MSTDRDVSRIVRSWLKEDGHEDADRVLDIVLDQLDATPQRRAGWLARRFPFMNNNFVRFGLAAAVVVLAVIVAVRFLPGSNVADEPEATPTPIPTATSDATPTAAAKTHVLTISEITPVRVTVTLPAGWGGNDWSVAKNDAALGAYPVTNVYTDPCQWQGSLPDPPVGPTVDDLATALVNQPMRDATATDFTLDGYSGKLVRMSVPADINFTDCDLGLFGSWIEAGSDNPSRYHQGPGQLDDVYIIDVEGVRMVLDVSYFPSISAADLAQIEELVASISIQP